ncbi:MAG: nucleotidyl transferase AbiEii/AbiGii toxin family protein [Oscillospiraceae bacterium]|nr:nucleotidyl transferase AbiEii/AbiGii toxin family protein [Oscillospiraceae bacterium]
MLHNDRELFEQLILRTSEALGIKAEIIEKDYYVTLFLKELVSVSPDIIFKGGTSLSKCYHLIDRFSEDIDLNIETETKPSESRRKQLKSSIVEVIDKLNFTLTNSEIMSNIALYCPVITNWFTSLCLRLNCFLYVL